MEDNMQMQAASNMTTIVMAISGIQTFM